MYIQMGKLKFTITNIFFWVGAILSVFVFENITFFSNNSSSSFYKVGMEDSFFFTFTALALLSYIFLIAYDTVFNKAKANIPVLMGCLIVFICGSIGIYLFETMEFVGEIPSYGITRFEKIKQILTLLLFCLTVYSCIFYFSKNHPSIKRLRYLLIIVVLAVFGFIIYSIFAELDKYTIIAWGGNVSKSTVSIKSVFQNSNMFAGMITLGIASAIGLNYFKKNVFSYLMIAFFAAIQVFVLSKTGSIVSFSLIFVYFLMEVIVNFLKKKKTAFLRLAIFVVTTVLVLIIFAVSQVMSIPLLSPCFRSLYRELSTSDFETFTQRTKIWHASIELLKTHPENMIFGFGQENTNYIVGRAINAHGFKMSCHNAFVQVLLNFGIVGMVFYGALLIYYIYCLIRLLKYDYRFAMIYGTIGIGYFAVGFTETISAFYPSAQGFLLGAMFYLPAMNKWMHLRKQEVGDYVIEKNSAPTLLKPSLMVKFAGMMILCLMSIAAIFLAFDEIRASRRMYYLLLDIVVLLAMAFVTVPYLCGLWSKDGKIGKFILNFLVGIVPMVGIASGLTAVAIIYRDVTISGFKWAIPVVIAFMMIAEVVIYSVLMKGNFKLYLETFKSLLMSLGSLIGFGMLFTILWFVESYLIPYSIVTYVLVGLADLIFFFGFSYLVPSEDLFGINTFVNDFDSNLMKRDVIRDRLEARYVY